MMTDEEQLIGSKTLTDGNVEVVEGPVLIAMRNGTALLLDEIDAGSANTLLCLQPILEGKPYYFKLKNEMVVPAPGFNVFATANTKGKGSDDGRYIGTNVLNEAFLERFAVTFEQEYPSAKIEVKIIKNLMESFNAVDEDFAETLVKWAEAIRRTFEDGGVDETITTRRMIHIVRAFAIFKDRTKAVQLCCNRFDAATKVAFLDLFEKVSTPEPVAVAPSAPEYKTEEEIPF
jgi:MoxR-like ATPase